LLYLFDANVLITAKNAYYPIDQIPEYWEWIQFQGSAGNIKLPLEIMEEILGSYPKSVISARRVVVAGRSSDRSPQ
jgi:Domain of unknown function (DUF4411)